MSTRGIAAIVAIGLIIMAFSFRSTETPPQSSEIAPTRTILVGGATIRVQVVDTDASRQRGLSGIAGLADDEGMLFIFEEDGLYSFWMHEMRFSIDILWIDSEGTVVHLEKDLAPETYPQSFTPLSPARYVLEVAAGFSEAHGIHVGSRVILDQNNE